MKRLLSLLAVTFATTLSLGCTGESATHAQTATRSDSAGIEIVTSTVPAWTTETAWRLSAAPVLDIGTLDGPDENQLFRVLMARRSTDGRIYVANTGTHEIRVFDSGGEHLRSFGREGDGPGEFRHPVRFDFGPGDTLHVWEGFGRQVSVLSDSGDFARSVPLNPTEDGTFFTYRGLLSSGKYVMEIRTFGSGPRDLTNKLVQTDYVLALLGTSGAVDTVGTFSFAPIWRHTRRQEPGDAIAIYMYPLPLAGGSSQQALGDSIYVTPGDRAEVRVYASDGALVRILRFPGNRRRMTHDLMERWLDEEILRRGLERDDAKVFRDPWADAPLADSTGVVSQIIIASDRSIWLRTIGMPRDTVLSWNVLSADGAWLGAVTTPRGFTVYEIGADYMLGRWQDELDIEYVLMYGLEKP